MGERTLKEIPKDHVMQDSVVVTPDLKIKDYSGRYACPQCWYKTLGSIGPEDTHCKACDKYIIWVTTLPT